jgi:hypothetical protein
MDTKKSAARAAKEVRTPTTRNVERSQILTKRPSVAPSAPPADLSARRRDSAVDLTARRRESADDQTVKRRDNSSLPPAVPENDNNAAKKAPVAIGRGRLPTGSLHTEARVPAEAETIKQRLTAIVNVQQKLSELKRSSQKHFYQIGELLHRVREQRLYEVKGYGSFEAFIEREVNLGQQFCLQSVRIYETFLPDAVVTYGFARLVTALDALEPTPTSVMRAGSGSDNGKSARSPIPPHKL